MTFSYRINSANKAEARNDVQTARANAPNNFPHPLVEFLLTSIDGIAEDGPIRIELDGHVATPDSHQISGTKLIVGPAGMFEGFSGFQSKEIAAAREDCDKLNAVVDEQIATIKELTAQVDELKTVVEGQDAELVKRDEELTALRDAQAAANAKPDGEKKGK